MFEISFPAISTFLLVLSSLTQAQTTTAGGPLCPTGSTAGVPPALLTACSIFSSQLAHGTPGELYSIVYTYAPTTYYASTESDGSVTYVAHTDKSSSTMRSVITSLGVAGPRTGTQTTAGGAAAATNSARGTVSTTNPTDAAAAAASSRSAAAAAAASASSAAASRSSSGSSGLSGGDIAGIVLGSVLGILTILILILLFCACQRRRSHRHARDVDGLLYKNKISPPIHNNEFGAENGAPMIPAPRDTVIGGTWFSNNSAEDARDFEKDSHELGVPNGTVVSDQASRYVSNLGHGPTGPSTALATAAIAPAALAASRKPHEDPINEHAGYPYQQSASMAPQNTTRNINRSANTYPEQHPKVSEPTASPLHNTPIASQQSATLSAPGGSPLSTTDQDVAQRVFQTPAEPIAAGTSASAHTGLAGGLAAGAGAGAGAGVGLGALAASRVTPEQDARVGNVTQQSTVVSLPDNTVLPQPRQPTVSRLVPSESDTAAGAAVTTGSGLAIASKFHEATDDEHPSRPLTSMNYNAQSDAVPQRSETVIRTTGPQASTAPAQTATSSLEPVAVFSQIPVAQTRDTATPTRDVKTPTQSSVAPLQGAALSSTTPVTPTKYSEDRQFTPQGRTTLHHDESDRDGSNYASFDQESHGYATSETEGEFVTPMSSQMVLSGTHYFAGGSDDELDNTPRQTMIRPPGEALFGSSSRQRGQSFGSDDTTTPRNSREALREYTGPSDSDTTQQQTQYITSSSQATGSGRQQLNTAERPSSPYEDFDFGFQGIRGGPTASRG